MHNSVCFIRNNLWKRDGLHGMGSHGRCCLLILRGAPTACCVCVDRMSGFEIEEYSERPGVFRSTVQKPLFKSVG